MTTSFKAHAKYLVPLLLFFASCGYTLVGRGSSLPPGISSVSIPMLENKTGEPDLDTQVTEVVKDEFIKDGRLKVDDSGGADSELKGSIVRYSLRPLAYDSDRNVTEYMVELVIDIKFIDKHSGKTVLKQPITTNWRYVVDKSITEAESLRQDATKTAAKQASELIISLVIESF